MLLLDYCHNQDIMEARFDEILTLFAQRDAAVTDQDREAFLATQVGEIHGGSSENYLAIQNLTSEVLHVHETGQVECLAWVKETYAPEGKDPYSSYPVYFLVKTVNGWRVYQVR